MDDGRLIELYRMWSESNWAAGFMSPYPDVVVKFREWLRDAPGWSIETAEPYELEMLAEFHRQEAENGAEGLNPGVSGITGG